MAIPESDPAKIADLGVFGGLVERTSRDAHHRRPEVDNDGGPPVATSDHASGGPIPAASATEHVWLPSAKRSLYGRLMRWLSGKVLKNSTASTSWLCRPLVGGAPPGQYTATFSV